MAKNKLSRHEENKYFPQYKEGCDLCKREIETQRFDGFCGDILYLCRDCVMKLKSIKQKN